jgi:hypothetical protein
VAERSGWFTAITATLVGGPGTPPTAAAAATAQKGNGDNGGVATSHSSMSELDRVAWSGVDADSLLEWLPLLSLCDMSGGYRPRFGSTGTAVRFGRGIRTTCCDGPFDTSMRERERFAATPRPMSSVGGEASGEGC